MRYFPVVQAGALLIVVLYVTANTAALALAALALAALFDPRIAALSRGAGQ